MWSNIFNAGNTNYRSQATHTNVITYGYFWVSHMWQPENPVQSHWLQILLCKRSYILKPGSYDISTLYWHNKAVTEQISCIMKNFI